jgi:hypothetical protein
MAKPRSRSLYQVSERILFPIGDAVMIEEMAFFAGFKLAGSQASALVAKKGIPGELNTPYRQHVSRKHLRFRPQMLHLSLK